MFCLPKCSNCVSKEGIVYLYLHLRWNFCYLLYFIVSSLRTRITPRYRMKTSSFLGWFIYQIFLYFQVDVLRLLLAKGLVLA